MSKGTGRKKSLSMLGLMMNLDGAIKKVGKGYMLQRYKGLGEMNADQLWDTTMDPETRTLIRVTIEDGARAERRVTTLWATRLNRAVNGLKRMSHLVWKKIIIFWKMKLLTSRGGFNE